MTTTAGVPAELATYEPEPPAGQRPPRRRGTTVGPVLRYTIAGLMLGAAGTHFAMMGEHAGVSWTHRTFFAVVAWLQVGIAATILLRPSRSVALACIGINIATLTVWVLTRTVGIAIGGDGAPQAGGRGDGAGGGFGGVAAAAAMPLLLPRGGRRPDPAAGGAAGAAAL